MAKTPATHSGHCQDCGNVQKLPGGKLSLHGYTVEWSQFIGDCPGSYQLPYELSCDRIKARIEQAIAQADFLNRAATQWRNGEKLDPEGRPIVAVNVYFGSKGRTKGYYAWQLLNADQYELSDNGRTLAFDHPDTGKRNVERTYSSESVVEKLNGLYADHLVREADQNLRYAEWQQTRVDNWVPNAPLIPVVTEKVLPEGRCPGSGAETDNWSARYLACKTCGKYVANRNGRFATHNSPEASK